MRVKFDLSGAVEKMTIFKELEGKANLDCHVEVEFGPDELGMIYEFQKNMIPQILDFAKEMQQMSNKRQDDHLETLDLENKIKKLEYDLEVKNLELERVKAKVSRTEKDKNFWKNELEEVLKGGKKKEEKEEESDLI